MSLQSKHRLVLVASVALGSSCALASDRTCSSSPVLTAPSLLQAGANLEGVVNSATMVFDEIVTGSSRRLGRSSHSKDHSGANATHGMVAQSSSSGTTGAANTSHRQVAQSSSSSTKAAANVSFASHGKWPLPQINESQIPSSVMEPQPWAPYNDRVGEEAGLFVELHLRGQNLQQLHNNAHDSLAEFLHTLHHALAASVDVSERRIGMTSIYGRYQRGLEGKRESEEVVVKFQLNRAKQKGEPSSEKVLSLLIAKLSSPQDPLMTGPLGPTLRNATLARSLISGFAPAASRRRAAAKVSSMALPIGISAAFTGVLIWLAAW